MSEASHGWSGHAQRNILAGILILVPIWITVVVFGFIFGVLSKVGRPVVQAAVDLVETTAPGLAGALLNPWFQSALGVLLTVVALYLLGWIATKVIGRRLIHMFDTLMQRIPLVQTIYGGTKKLLASLQQKPDQVQRVVLIEFPTPGMKTVGFVTRLLTDHATGQQLAAVYVPTTPNPTSGYLEIISLDKLVSTDWTMDQAMTFIISGGAVAPDHIHYSKSAGLKE